MPEETPGGAREQRGNNIYNGDVMQYIAAFVSPLFARRAREGGPQWTPLLRRDAAEGAAAPEGAAEGAAERRRLA